MVIRLATFEINFANRQLQKLLNLVTLLEEDGKYYFVSQYVQEVLKSSRVKSEQERVKRE